MTLICIWLSLPSTGEFEKVGPIFSSCNCSVEQMTTCHLYPKKLTHVFIILLNWQNHFKQNWIIIFGFSLLQHQKLKTKQNRLASLQCTCSALSALWSNDFEQRIVSKIISYSM